MSNINKHALIAKIKKQAESFDTVVLREDEANALLDELEAAKKRIAELEEREILLPERSSMLHRTDFHDDYQTVMAYKVSEVIDAIRATGIRIKGDAGEQNDEKP